MIGPAIVVGSGRCVWDDLAAIGRPEAPVFAINDMIVYSPRVDHGVSHHAIKLPHWLALRPGPTDRIRLHSSAIRTTPGVKSWPAFKGGGSSTLLAARIALAMGYGPVYVAGTPLDASGNIFSDPSVTLQDYARYRETWERVRSDLVGRVVGVSGFLRDLLEPAQAVA